MVQRLAVDMDNTLALTHEAFFQEYNFRYGTAYSVDVVDTWNFADHPVSYDTVHRITQELWADGGTRIRPVDTGLGSWFDRLNAVVDTVDIVTGREGREDAMQAWLARQGVEPGKHYTAFIVEQDKAQLGYDLYHDDNPHLAAEAPTVVPERPYAHVAGDDPVAYGGPDTVMDILQQD